MKSQCVEVQRGENADPAIDSMLPWICLIYFEPEAETVTGPRKNFGKWHLRTYDACAPSSGAVIQRVLPPIIDDQLPVASPIPLLRP